MPSAELPLHALHDPLEDIQGRNHNLLSTDESTERQMELKLQFHSDIKKLLGWVQWLTPVIPALWEAKEGRSFELRSSRATW